MQVVTALLCDKANARDGLLNVIGGGITRLWRAEYPAPTLVELALMIELHRSESERPHQIDIELIGEDGDMLFEVRGAFQSDGSQLDVWERLLVPFVVNLSNVAIPKPGPYNIEISIDNNHQNTLSFKAELIDDQLSLDDDS